MQNYYLSEKFYQDLEITDVCDIPPGQRKAVMEHVRERGYMRLSPTRKRRTVKGGAA